MDVKLSDPIGISAEVLRLLDVPDGPKHVFYGALVDEVVQELGISLEDHERQRLLARINREGIPPRKISNFIFNAFQVIHDEGRIPEWIDKYESASEIDPNKFTQAVRDGMSRFILERGIQIHNLDPEEGANFLAFQEHLADAYQFAIQRSSNIEDPLVAVQSQSSVSTWDFVVDTFDTADSQEIIPVNVRAAGALFYIYYLGEYMGIFRLVDALTLNWASGAIDVVDGDGADKLYSYWKKREDRLTQQEMMMQVKRVFNIGDARVLNRMVVNEHFEGLWRNLMTEVTDYIDKRTEANGTTEDFSPVSPKGIEHVSSLLAYNLTEHCVGMTHMYIRELYAQLQEAIEILRDDQVMEHFGGRRRKTLGRVIEELSRQEDGRGVNFATINTLAVEGYNIFTWLVVNDVTDEGAFNDFLDSAEKWIIAKSSEDSGFDQDEDFMEEGDFDEFEDAEEFEDEFADF